LIQIGTGMIPIEIETFPVDIVLIHTGIALIHTCIGSIPIGIAAIQVEIVPIPIGIRVISIENASMQTAHGAVAAGKVAVIAAFEREPMRRVGSKNDYSKPRLNCPLLRQAKGGGQRRRRKFRESEDRIGLQRRDQTEARTRGAAADCCASQPPQ
jgi:hypothetical protein